jgi:hypothetical protein
MANSTLLATLKEDIHKQSAWLVKAFKSDRIGLDYTIESFKKIDLFFEQNSVPGKANPNGRLSKNLGPVLFSIGAYVGNTIIKALPGSIWITDDKDPEGEITAQVKLPNGSIIWPMQRVINRFKNGSEDSIFPYGAVLVSEISNDHYWEKTKENQMNLNKVAEKKPWWKFW